MAHEDIGTNMAHMKFQVKCVSKVPCPAQLSIKIIFVRNVSLSKFKTCLKTNCEKTLSWRCDWHAMGIVRVKCKGQQLHSFSGIQGRPGRPVSRKQWNQTFRKLSVANRQRGNQKTGYVKLRRTKWNEALFARLIRKSASTRIRKFNYTHTWSKDSFFVDYSIAQSFLKS